MVELNRPRYQTTEWLAILFELLTSQKPDPSLNLLANVVTERLARATAVHAALAHCLTPKKVRKW